MKAVPFEALAPEVYRDVVRRALEEDLGAGDITTQAVVEAEQRATGVVLVKSACVIAGLDVFGEVFRQMEADSVVLPKVKDGTRCEPGATVAVVRGRARTLLTAERTALNLLQRLSGTATLARRFVDAAAGRIVILDTRKTTPGLRALEKFAVRAGGAVNHRFGLHDAVLIKDNHVRLAGGVEPAVARMRAAGTGLPIEVEAQDLSQVEAALRAGAELILLDNLSTPDIVAAVTRCLGRARTEISGGVTLARLPELAETGADYVSVGALTHSAPAADISFEIEPE